MREKEVKKGLIEGIILSWSFKFLGVYLKIIKFFSTAAGVQNQREDQVNQKSVR